MAPLILFIGAALVVSGVAMLSTAAAVIVAGVLVMAAAAALAIVQERKTGPLPEGTR